MSSLHFSSLGAINSLTLTSFTISMDTGLLCEIFRQTGLSLVCPPPRGSICFLTGMAPHCGPKDRLLSQEMGKVWKPFQENPQMVFGFPPWCTQSHKCQPRQPLVNDVTIQEKGQPCSACCLHFHTKDGISKTGAHFAPVSFSFPSAPFSLLFYLPSPFPN